MGLRIALGSNVRGKTPMQQKRGWELVGGGTRPTIRCVWKVYS